MKPYWILLSLCVPLMSHATGGVKITRGEGEGTAKFFPLPPRDSVTVQNGVKIIRESPAMPLPSDREAVEKGSLRIDRTRAVPNPKTSAAKAKPAEANLAALGTLDTTLAPAPMTDLDADLMPESEAIEGLNEGNDPVLALFDSNEGGELLSFREAMSGKGLRGLFAWPLPLGVKQELSSGYGIRKDPFHGRRAFHGGIDIAAAPGTPVMAVAAGNVIEVENDARYGKYIGIQHSDGTISRYGHLSEQMVKKGQQVTAGQKIGAVGATGRATGPHLDFRVSRNGNRFDPLSVLRVPSGVAHDGIAVAQNQPNVRTVRGGVASNPLARAPMVIKVR